MIPLRKKKNHKKQRYKNIHDYKNNFLLQNCLVGIINHNF